MSIASHIEKTLFLSLWRKKDVVEIDWFYWFVGSRSYWKSTTLLLLNRFYNPDHITIDLSGTNNIVSCGDMAEFNYHYRATSYNHIQQYYLT